MRVPGEVGLIESDSGQRSGQEPVLILLASEAEDIGNGELVSEPEKTISLPCQLPPVTDFQIGKNRAAFSESVGSGHLTVPSNLGPQAWHAEGRSPPIDCGLVLGRNHLSIV